MSLMDMVQTKKMPTKKENKAKPIVAKKDKEKKQVSSNKKFKYPFEIYLAAERKDVSHIFEEDKGYSESEITKAMLEHGYYDFAGSVSYDFMDKDNVLVPTFQQHKKG